MVTGTKTLPRAGGRTLPAVLLLASWSVAVLWQASHHVFWRDEVRALSIATNGATVVDMLRGLHGEGHPAIWYLLLRAGHELIGNVALPVTAFLVALAGAVLLVWRAPFAWPVKALMLGSKFMLFEYSVMARNYGISMLAMFGFAALYPRFRNSAWVLGLVLALLANTCVNAVPLAGALWLFWALDTRDVHGWRWSPQARALLIAGILLAAGTLVAFMTVYPTYNDAYAQVHPLTLRKIVGTLLLPGHTLHPLWIVKDDLGPQPDRRAGDIATTLLLIVPLYRLRRAPIAIVAALVGLTGISMLFEFVYDASYRHAALVLVFGITIFWIVLARDASPAAGAPDRLRLRLGSAAAVAMLLCQCWLAGTAIEEQIDRPQSRAADLGRLIAADPGLHGAIVFGRPDYLIEALPYYAPGNPVYQMGKGDFGRVVHFTEHAKLDISLDDMLDTGAQLARQHHVPVLILIRYRLLDNGRGVIEPENPVGSFRYGPASLARLRRETVKLADFSLAVSDESYAVYRLNPPPPLAPGPLPR